MGGDIGQKHFILAFMSFFRGIYINIKDEERGDKVQKPSIFPFVFVFRSIEYLKQINKEYICTKVTVNYFKQEKMSPFRDTLP